MNNLSCDRLNQVLPAGRKREKRTASLRNWQRKSETEKEVDRDKETKTETDKKKDRDRQACRQAGRKTNTQAGRPAVSQTDRQAGRQAGRDGQTKWPSRSNWKGNWTSNKCTKAGSLPSWTQDHLYMEVRRDNTILMDFKSWLICKIKRQYMPVCKAA